MRVQEPFRLTLLILTSTVLLLGNGCRSGMNNGESFWKRPNLPSLAFGKKSDDAVPKPPAAHFDPTPAKTETELAAKKGATKNTSADLKNSLDNLAKANPKTLEKRDVIPAGKVADGSNKTSAQPLRTPYQVSSAAPSTKPDSPVGGAVDSKKTAGLIAKNGTSEFKLPDTFKAEAKNQLAPVAKSADQARAQFNTDMQGLASSTKSRVAGLNNGVSNGLAAVAPKAESKVVGGAAETNNSVALVEKKLSDEQRRLEAEVAKAKQEIADLKKQLTTNNQMLAPLGSAQPVSPQSVSGAQSGVQSRNQIPSSQLRVASNQNFQPVVSKPSQALAGGAKVENQFAQGNTNQIGFEPLRPNMSAGSASTASGSQYPSTSHVGFSTAENSRISKPDTNIRPVTLQSPVNSNVGHVEAQQDFGSTTAEIDIPESVLRGTGSFSPGSVNRLRGD